MASLKPTVWSSYSDLTTQQIVISTIPAVLLVLSSSSKRQRVRQQMWMMPQQMMPQQMWGMMPPPQPPAQMPDAQVSEEEEPESSTIAQDPFPRKRDRFPAVQKEPWVAAVSWCFATVVGEFHSAHPTQIHFFPSLGKCIEITFAQPCPLRQLSGIELVWMLPLLNGKDGFGSKMKSLQHHGN